MLPNQPIKMKAVGYKLWLSSVTVCSDLSSGKTNDAGDFHTLGEPMS